MWLSLLALYIITRYANNIFAPWQFVSRSDLQRNLSHQRPLKNHTVAKKAAIYTLGHERSADSLLGTSS